MQLIKTNFNSKLRALLPNSFGLHYSYIFSTFSVRLPHLQGYEFGDLVTYDEKNDQKSHAIKNQARSKIIDTFYKTRRDLY